MEDKKFPAKDLSRLSNLFTSIGLTLSLTFVLTAFEWKSVQDPIVDLRGLEVPPDNEVLVIPPTQIIPPKPVVRLPVFIVTTKKQEETIDIPPIDIDPESSIDIPTAAISAEPEFSKEIILFPEEQASPVGGFEAFYKFVSEKLSGRYPPQARRMSIEGRVFVEFVVERDGSLSGVKAVKGIGAGCDELAVKVVESAPRWNPGKQRGKPVRQRYTIPIIFKLG